MALVKISEISHGKVLAKDVTDWNSRLLLYRGQVMGSRHIRILKMWGVCEVDVVDDTAADKKDFIR